MPISVCVCVGGGGGGMMDGAAAAVLGLGFIGFKYSDYLLH